MHCNRRDFVVWMSDLFYKCPLTGFHKIQTKEIKCRQFSPSPCLFAEPEAVSKHSVSLWIGYSDHRYISVIHRIASSNGLNSFTFLESFTDNALSTRMDICSPSIRNRYETTLDHELMYCTLEIVSWFITLCIFEDAK